MQEIDWRARLPWKSGVLFLLPLFLLSVGCPEAGDDDTNSDDDSVASVDADGDGWTEEAGDCDDEDETVFPGAEEVCDDDRDNDCDLLTDCDDTDCSAEPSCIPICSNGLDDDGDGWTDLDDPGCAGDPSAGDEGGYDLSLGCNDGIDNDGDGLIDSDDPECAGVATADEFPETETDCTDEIDDDGDGDIDCDDSDCNWHPVCIGPVNGYLLIPAGIFTMGSPVGEVGHEVDEVQHQVTLTRSFYIGETEVTQLEFETVMSWNPSDCDWGCGDELPVQQMSWFDALAYANEVSAGDGLTPCYDLSNVECEDGTQVGTSFMDCMNPIQEGIRDASVDLAGVATPYECEGFRLPMEAEWEYAARAGETAALPNGGNLYSGDEEECHGNLLLDNGTYLDDIAWYCGNTYNLGSWSSEPVGGLQPNNWGLYDTIGNVWEWTWDEYTSYGGDVVDPASPGPMAGSVRICRGGSWGSTPAFTRIADRVGIDPYLRGDFRGLRLARSAH